MKKYYFYALTGAIALAGAVGLSACSSSEDASEPNPLFDGEAVKTQFSLSLPWDNSATTRQGYGVVQEGAVIGTTTDISKFRGMSNIVLIPYSNATDRANRLGANITLGENKILKPGDVSNSANTIPNGKLLEKSTAVLYNDVTIPVGTAGFLFYGEATAGEGGDFANGKLTAAGLDGESSAITFRPTPILGWSNPTTFEINSPTTTIGEALATYVSSIAAASYDTEGTENDVEFIWAKCANTANSGQSWYNAGLGDMYKTFTSLKPGASSYVQAAVQELYTSILNNTDKVSQAIKAAILNATYASDAEETGTLTFTEAITGYPGNINMPEGAAALDWNYQPVSEEVETDDLNKPKIATAVAGSNYGHTVEAPTTSTMNVVDMTNIVYPASLYYFVDSPIKVSNTSRIDDYNGVNNWETILTKYTNGTAVSSATRSVAVTNAIQYAVGRLDVKVNKLDKAHYYDRKGMEVVLPGEGFQLTGVLIGGQKYVDYQFEQSGSDEFTIYDKTINTENASGINNVSQKVTASLDAGPTYTLALQTAVEQNVFVALEFVNSAEDFQGYDGVVKKGCKFYMIAQLNPTADVDEKVSGVDNTGKRVFKQDFKTIANFTFGAGSLDADGDGESDTPGGFAKAYTTIPDLRTPQLELGLSVDLEWQSGIQFDVEF